MILKCIVKVTDKYMMLVNMDQIYSVLHMLLRYNYISDLTNALRVEDVILKDDLIYKDHLIWTLDG